MDGKSLVLIVDDEQINREILKKILKNEYGILEATNGKEAIKVLEEHHDSICAVLMDLIMEGGNGYEFLEVYNKMEIYKGIPVIVATAAENVQSEKECLRLGAWDFIRKPFDPELIMFRIKNAVDKSELNLLREIRYRDQFDALTGLYKKEKFVEETHIMLENSDENVDYAMVHFDIAKFQVYNSIFGMEDGDRLLKYLSSLIVSISKKIKITYSHESADEFFICVPIQSEEDMKRQINLAKKLLNGYKQKYELNPKFGLYFIKDKTESVYDMMEKAKMAAKKCKQDILKDYYIYTEDISEQIHQEQVISNKMRQALEEEQFVLYIQPKYEILHNTICGGEVLVRWQDPEKGMISPGVFIPVFERNGFIMELDFYMWEHTCKLIRRWLDEGKKPYPVSVNISRISLYNPNLVSDIIGLAKKYNVPPELFQLELTESAYTSNPIAIKEAMIQLQKNGFVILMDDFGSGYSSLNVLKDIAVDILKIDMKFMAKCDIPGRIGCEYVQGYYFAKPMPVSDYEARAFGVENNEEHNVKSENVNTDDLCKSTLHLETLFSDISQAVAVYEFDNDTIDIIRVNSAYYDLFGFTNLADFKIGLLDYVLDEYKENVLKAFRLVAETKTVAECEYKRKLGDGSSIWVRMKLKYINEVGSKPVLFGMLSDISAQKEVDLELQKYRNAIESVTKQVNTLLIVDDLELNRAVLGSIFDEKYRIIEAANGLEALDIIKKQQYDIDLVLLDMMMPVMDGKQFLEYKKTHNEMENIPVIIITADDSTAQQVDTLSLGASDYIVKPFVPEVVRKRVTNVLESTRRLGQVV